MNVDLKMFLLTHMRVEIFKGMDKGGSPYFWLYETSVGSQVTGSQVDLNRDGIVWTVVLLRHCLLHCLVFHGWLAGWCLMIPLLKSGIFFPWQVGRAGFCLGGLPLGIEVTSECRGLLDIFMSEELLGSQPGWLRARATLTFMTGRNIWSSSAIGFDYWRIWLLVVRQRMNSLDRWI